MTLRKFFCFTVSDNIEICSSKCIFKFWCFFLFFYSVTIRDKLIPHAVSWFTGEALVDEDEYDDDDDEDDENDD